jgi:hypothetical protein
MTKKKFRLPLLTRTTTVFIVIALLFVLPLISAGVFELLYINRVYPGVKMADVDLGYKTYDQARDALRHSFEQRASTTITYVIPRSGSVDAGTVQEYVNYDLDTSTGMALSFGRQGSLLRRFQDLWLLLRHGYTLTPTYSFNKDLLENRIDGIVNPYEKQVVNSTLGLTKDMIYITQAEEGMTADRDHALRDLDDYLSFKTDTSRIFFVMHPHEPDITAEKAHDAVAKAQKALSKTVVLKSSYVPSSVWTLDKSTVFSLIDLTLSDDKRIDVAVKDYKVASYSAKIASIINKDPVEARFQLDGDRVTVFEQGQPGYALDSAQLTQQISDALFNDFPTARVKCRIVRWI